MMQSYEHESLPPGTPPESVPATDRAEKGRSRLSVAVAALIVGVGLATVLGALPLGYWTELGPGPGFFPFWLGILLAALGAGWALTELLSWRTGAPRRPVDPLEEPPEYSLRTASAIVVSLVVLAACLEVVGYQLSMLFFLLFHLLVLGKRGLLLSVVIAVAGSFGVFVVFTQLLAVPLPASSLPLLRGWGL